MFTKPQARMLVRMRRLKLPQSDQAMRRMFGRQWRRVAESLYAGKHICLMPQRPGSKFLGWTATTGLGFAVEDPDA